MSVAACLKSLPGGASDLREQQSQARSCGEVRLAISHKITLCGIYFPVYAIVFIDTETHPIIDGRPETGAIQAPARSSQMPTTTLTSRTAPPSRAFTAAW